MLKSCQYCGKIHDEKIDCGKKPQKQKKITYIDRFRSSRKWREKRERIRSRDLGLCVVCRLNDLYVYNGLSCHHIEPLEKRFDLRLEDNNLITLCLRHHEEAECGKISKEYLKDIIKNS